MGTLRTDLVGTMSVTGTVSDAGVVSFTGQGSGPICCQGLCGSTGVVRSTDTWSAEVTKAGEIAGTFRQYALQGISSCYKSMFEYRSDITSLRHVAQ